MVDKLLDSVMTAEEAEDFLYYRVREDLEARAEDARGLVKEYVETMDDPDRIEPATLTEAGLLLRAIHLDSESYPGSSVAQPPLVDPYQRATLGEAIAANRA